MGFSNNDMTIFSKNNDDHFSQLRKTFKKCRRFGLSLNPKKSSFDMQEGNLLGHIVSKDGVRIDPKRLASIQEWETPRNKKEVQSFIRRVNVLRRFIPNMAKQKKNHY